jgi:hypothetical protein
MRTARGVFVHDPPALPRHLEQGMRASGRAANRNRSAKGKLITHWRSGSNARRAHGTLLQQLLA